MADSYYYQINGQTLGPLTPSALKQLANEGVIVESTPVRRGEQGAWYQAGTIAGLVPPKPAADDAPPSFEAEAAERARLAIQMAGEHAEKVAAKLWFLDLKFSQLFTPKLIGPLWAIYLCLIVIVFLFSAVNYLFTLNVLLAIFMIVVQLIALVFAAIAGRIVLEVLLVVFRTAQRLESQKPSEDRK
jgi:hypothetical protein